MTNPFGGQRHARPPDSPALTDSGVHKLMLGTRVTLHLHGGVEIEVGLAAIRDVTTWTDLVERIIRAMPVEVLASRRRVFAGGVVLWAEVSSDAVEEPRHPGPAAHNRGPLPRT